MTLHLRNPLTQRLGAPIRRSADGEWLYARGYGLRGGGKSAEQILSDALAHLDQHQARALLDQFEFPAAQKDEFERMAATAIGRQHNIPAWLEKYRRAGGSHAPPLQLPVAAPGVRQALARFKITERLDTLALPFEGEQLDTWVLDNEVLYVSRKASENGTYNVSRIKPRHPTKLESVGVVTNTGIYRLRQFVGAAAEMEYATKFYVPLDDGFYRVRFEEGQGAWRVVDKLGHDHQPIYVEPGSGHVGHYQWRVSPHLADQPRLNAMARQILGLPATGEDAAVRRYVSAYSQQIIKASTPAIRLASNVPHMDAMTHDFIVEHGWPYAQLEQLMSAQLRGERLPDWAPQYDALQGLVSLKPTPTNVYTVTLHAKQQDHLALGALKETEIKDLSDLNLASQMVYLDYVERREANISIVADILANRGYVRLSGGRSGTGSNGLAAVFIGPNGDTYVMEVKRFTQSDTGNFNTVNTANPGGPPQLSDAWLMKHVNLSLLHFPGNPAALAVRQAHAQGRLYRLLGGTTPQEEVLVFRAYGPGEALAVPVPSRTSQLPR